MTIAKKMFLGIAVGVFLAAIAGGLAVQAGVMSLPVLAGSLLFVALVPGILAWFVSAALLRPLRQLTLEATGLRRCETTDSMPATHGGEISTLRGTMQALATQLAKDHTAAEMQVARAQQAMRLAINTLPHGIAVLSPDGHVELANQTAERLLGLSPGKHAAQLNLHWLDNLFAAATAGKTALPASTAASPLQVFDQGAERFFLPSAVPIRGLDGQTLGVTIVLADATQTRLVDEAKSGLLSTVSHELKTPLTSIKMSLGLLLENNIGDLNPQQRELLTAAAEDAERLHKMIQDLLDSARGQAANRAAHNGNGHVSALQRF